jgi:hypothetical protein
MGYVEPKATLCPACLNIGLLRFARKQLEERGEGLRARVARATKEAALAHAAEKGDEP